MHKEDIEALVADSVNALFLLNKLNEKYRARNTDGYSADGTLYSVAILNELKAMNSFIDPNFIADITSSATIADLLKAEGVLDNVYEAYSALLSQAGEEARQRAETIKQSMWTIQAALQSKRVNRENPDYDETADYRALRNAVESIDDVAEWKISVEVNALNNAITYMAQAAKFFSDSEIEGAKSVHKYMQNLSKTARAIIVSEGAPQTLVYEGPIDAEAIAKDMFHKREPIDLSRYSREVRHERKHKSSEEAPEDSSDKQSLYPEYFAGGAIAGGAIVSYSLQFLIDSPDVGDFVYAILGGLVGGAAGLFINYIRQRTPKCSQRFEAS